MTDRLHGHILSMLADLPHVLMGNSNGKVRSFYETWTSSTRGVIWADTVEQAIEMVESLCLSPPLSVETALQSVQS